jgi:predicted O-methyltransferase YrrM
MTTREATPLLMRGMELGLSRDASDWGKLLAYGAVQWPWLLKSLYGGRKADKCAMLERVGLAPDALPNLGSWKADVGLLNLIIDTILELKPHQVVELGAGASTLVVARALHMVGQGGRVTSFDQHADFVARTRNWVASHGLHADLHHAPLHSPTGAWADLWYDLSALPEAIDLLLIDGPPWAINPTGRRHAQALFDRITPGGIVLLDDAARPGERIVAMQWKRDWPQFDWRFIPGIKGSLMGQRR